MPDLTAEQPDITVERKGPRVDAPEKAIQGFLKSTGLTLDDCEQRETPKGPVWFAVKQEKGRPTGDLLAELLLPRHWPPSPGPSPCAGTRAAYAGCAPSARSSACWMATWSPSASAPSRADGPPSAIDSWTPDRTPSPMRTATRRPSKTAKVMLDPEQRKFRRSWTASGQLKRKKGCNPLKDDWLVGENAGLVEWPVVLKGRIDPRFMDLPPEVLRSAMRTHQRYFAAVS